jgi:hypothetical protein
MDEKQTREETAMTKNELHEALRAADVMKGLCESMIHTLKEMDERAKVFRPLLEKAKPCSDEESVLLDAVRMVPGSAQIQNFGYALEMLEVLVNRRLSQILLRERAEDEARQQSLAEAREFRPSAAFSLDGAMVHG